MTVCLLSLADQCRSMRAPDRRCFDTECPMRLKKVVGGYKELREKLGRNDPCPCLLGRRFQELLHVEWRE